PEWQRDSDPLCLRRQSLQPFGHVGHASSNTRWHRSLPPGGQENGPDLTSFSAWAESVGPVPYEGHSAASGHTPHAGLRAWQMRRPCQITRWEKIVHSLLGSSSPTACSILTGS